MSYIGTERPARGAPRLLTGGLTVHHTHAHLDRSEPALLDVAEELVADAGLVGPAPGSVGGHPLGAPAAEQAPHGRAERLAGSQARIDTGDGRSRAGRPSQAARGHDQCSPLALYSTSHSHSRRADLPDEERA
jgi:hypothetical protein